MDVGTFEMYGVTHRIVTEDFLQLTVTAYVSTFEWYFCLVIVPRQKFLRKEFDPFIKSLEFTEGI